MEDMHNDILRQVMQRLSPKDRVSALAVNKILKSVAIDANICIDLDIIDHDDSDASDVIKCVKVAAGRTTTLRFSRWASTCATSVPV